MAEVGFERLYSEASGKIIDTAVALGFAQDGNNGGGVELLRLNEIVDRAEVIWRTLRQLEYTDFHLVHPYLWSEP